MSGGGEPTDLALPLATPNDLDPLLERIGDARYVLLGEASHGTSQYYRWREQLTRRLIAEKEFSFVGVEGDWPDCFMVNRWVKGDGTTTARQTLRGFDRWPTWMWANAEVAEFAEWLRRHNDQRPGNDRVGFYGLDVYSLWESMREILDYLGKHEPEHVDAALQAWRCFEPYGEDPQEYAWATRLVPTSCEDAVIDLLTQLRQVLDDGADSDDPEVRFAAEQNAFVAAGAERYYRAMVRGGGESWNVRDHHMTDTLDRLVDHHGPDAKAVVWEHNTHVGDARATDMAGAGMVNVGQLVRERHGDDGVVIIGFAGHRGSVIAGDAWGAPAARLAVPPARDGSAEDVLHGSVGRDALFVFPAAGDQPAWLRRTLQHRAIGVVYHPDRERRGNYVPSVLGDRYDALCYFEQTDALQPLDAEEPAEGELETFPAGT